MSDSLVVGSPQWLIPAIVLVSVTALVLIWSLIRSPVRGPIVWFSGLVKLIAVASLACYLLEPMIRSERPRPGANLVAVAVDNSRSMEIRTPGQTRSLLEKLKPRIAADAPWQTRLAQDFSVRRYLFDERLRSVEDFSDCNFEGQGSSIGSALSTITSRFASRPTAGLIVFTDGMATDTLPAISELDADMPIFPVIDFDKANVRDLSVIDPTVSQSAFEVAPVRIEAVLQADGLDGEQIVARLFNEKGESVESATFKVEGQSWRKRIRFQYRPKELGIQFVTIRAMIAGEDKAESGLPESRIESTTANNARLVAVDRSRGPYRVLYIAGRPNWEFKFLRRALEEDDELDWDALVRIAKKEAKFSFRDRAVDSTNPLFAGFDNAAEDATEQYDEPIVIPLGLRDGEEELKAGFPKTAEGLYVYDAVIIDDLEAKFFSHDQMLLLRQFVSDRGGGLLMLGGQESFDRGGYRDTPIGDMLPVYLQNSETAKADAPVNYRLTREGALEPWMRLRGSETEEARRLAEMPAFSVWNSVNGAKPGAAIVANLAVGGGDSLAPGLVTQQFGAGRTAALLVGDLWRWGMRRPDDKNDDLAQGWRQMARWLTADVPHRVEVEVVPPKSYHQPYKLVITVRDEKYAALDNALLKIDALQPDGKLIEVSATPNRKLPGIYEAEIWSTQDGPYVASVTADAPDGTRIGERDVGWAAEPSSAEFRTLKADLAPLTAVAEKTGGKLVDIDELDSFVRDLPTMKVPITEQRVDPLWHRAGWLLITLAALCLEWGVRRVRGLP